MGGTPCAFEFGAVDIIQCFLSLFLSDQKSVRSTCTFEGNSYDADEQFTWGEGLCTCHEGGSISCVAKRNAMRNEGEEDTFSPKTIAKVVGSCLWMFCLCHKSRNFAAAETENGVQEPGTERRVVRL